MATPTFTWNPDQGLVDAHEPQVFAVKYGDGYKEVRPVGLNSDMAEFTGISFTSRSLAEATLIRDFLEALGGTNPFYWTPPRRSTPLLFICPRWKLLHDTGVSFTVQADFEQVPA